MNNLLLRSIAIVFVLLYSNLYAQLQPVQNIPINGTSYVYGSSTYIAWYFNGYEAGLTVELQVSTNSDMSSPFVDVTGLTGLTYEVTGLTEGTTYYWRVRSKSSGGAYSAWTGIWSFTVSGYGGGATTPLKPVLNIPLDGSTVTSSTTWLAWYLNGSHIGLTYHVQVSTASNFSTFFVKDSGLTDLTYELSGLVDGETYYWRVRSKNSLGTKSDWSTTFSFNVDLGGGGGGVTPPTLYSPADGTTDFSYHPTLYWNSVSGAFSYDLQVSGDSTFTSIERQYYGLTDTSYHIHFPKATEYLELDSTYFWRVRVTTIMGTSDWTDPWDFTTKDTPDTPTQLSPADGFTASYTSVELVWSDVIKADSYTVEIYADTNSAATDTYTGADTSYTFNGTASTQYRWKVSSAAGLNASAFSGYWSFTTGSSTIWYVETPANGGDDLNSGTSPNDAFATIQKAIDSASPGDKISVGTGTFIEDLQIYTSNLELYGVHKDSTIIQGDSTLVNTYAPLAVPNIDIQADSVKIHDVTVQSPEIPTDDYASGIVLTGIDVELYNICFNSVFNTDSNYVPGSGYAIVIQTWRESNSLVYGPSDISGLKIYDNIFLSTNNGSGIGSYEGIYLNPRGTGSGLVTISGNNFTGNLHRGVAIETDNVLVDDNAFDTDVASIGSGVWSAYGDDHTISHNTITGFLGATGRGVGIYGVSWSPTPFYIGENIVVSGNSIYSNTTGVYLAVDYSAISVTTPPAINNNNIYDNTIGIDVTGSTGSAGYFVLNSENNFWGSSDGPQDTTYFDSAQQTGTSNEMPGGSATLVKTWVNNADSEGNLVLDNDTLDAGAGGFFVDYYPWLGGTPTLAIEDDSASTGGTVSLDVSTNLFSDSLNYTLTGRFVYDDSKLDFLSGTVGASTLLNTAGWSAVFYESSSGIVDFVAWGFSPISGSGNLFSLSFTVIAGASGSTAVTGSYSDFLADGANLFGTVGSFSGTVTYTYSATPSTVQGDADLDYDVDYDDVLVMAQHVAGSFTLTGQAFTNADVDTDADVDADDIASVVNFIVNGSFLSVAPPIVQANMVQFNDAVENSDNALLRLPFSVDATGHEVQSVEFILVYDENELDYQAFAGALEGNQNFVHASKISDGIAKFVFATSEKQSAKFDMGSLVFKKGSENLSSTITSIYKINGGAPQTGPSYDLDGVTSVEEELPTKFEVTQNYPNPFNPSTTIKYSVPSATFVTIKVYNMLGQEVKTLVNKDVAPGRFSVTWHGDNNYGSKVSSGTYIYQIVAGEFVQAKKMILLK